MDIKSVLLAAFAILNIAALVFVATDKQKSIAHSERIPEVYFFVWSVFGGSVGILLGMFIFHHKTRKWYFTLGTSFLVIQQLSLIYLLHSVL